MEDQEIFDHMVQDWIIDNEEDTEANENAYLQRLEQHSSLKILQQGRVDRAFDKRKKSGLFFLFLTNSWFDCVRTWTNKNLKEKGLKEVNEMKFWAYLGLEMAMSILQINDISYYWRKDMFTEASADPLWHSQNLLEHFQKNICQIAVPIGTSALDEASVRKKARTTASLYLPSKPDKYNIRLYAIVGSRNTYISSIVDNQAGSNTGESGAEAFCGVHREMRKPFNNTLGKSDIVDKDSPTGTLCHANEL